MSYTRDFLLRQHTVLDMVTRSVGTDMEWLTDDYMYHLSQGTLVRETHFLSRAIGAFRVIRRFLNSLAREILYRPGGLRYLQARTDCQLLSGQRRATRRNRLL
jgi:hypothetical protein